VSHAVSIAAIDERQQTHSLIHHTGFISSKNYVFLFTCPWPTIYENNRHHDPWEAGENKRVEPHGRHTGPRCVQSTGSLTRGSIMYYYAPPLIGGALSDAFVWRLSDVCLSVAYIRPKSRTERPKKTKIGTEVAHVTRDTNTTFKVKRSRSPGAALVGCTGRPTSTYSNGDLSICVHDVGLHRVTTCRPGRGLSWRPPAYSLLNEDCFTDCFRTTSPLTYLILHCGLSLQVSLYTLCTVVHKNVPVNCCQILRQILTDFNKFCAP